VPGRSALPGWPWRREGRPAEHEGEAGAGEAQARAAGRSDGERADEHGEQGLGRSELRAVTESEGAGEEPGGATRGACP
jgi:hypothetical protein